MKLTFKKFISEGINDKGILKAIFVVGLPGAGKSYTIQRLKGTVSPLIVNTDKAAEFISRKIGVPIKDEETWQLYFHDSSRRITKNLLTNYVDGMLPLFVDGTSNDVSNILHRIGILESLGYDVGVIFVHTSLATAKKRAAAREKITGRHVDDSYIEQIDRENGENRNYLKSKIAFFKDILNDEDELTDKVLMDAFRRVQGFFNSPVQNPVGKRIIEQLKQNPKNKNLSDAYLERDMLERKMEGWYR